MNQTTGQVQLPKPPQNMSRLGLRALQLQMKLYTIQEWLLIASFISAAGTLRILMQFIPNVEPITFFALLSGALFGWRKGFLVGSSSVWWSNYFVVGGQGPWSLFQIISFGLAGVLGSLIPLRKRNYSAVSALPYAFLSSFLASLSFEIIMNFSWALMFGMNPAFVFASGLAFFAVHLFSNLFFAAALPWTGVFVYEKAGLADRAVCRALIARLRSGNGLSRNSR